MTQTTQTSQSTLGVTHPDPLLDEIRAIKQKVSEAAGHDVQTLCRQLEQEQFQKRERLVDRRQR